eukprot:SAG22_NODE_1556_length_4131_cov_3.350942_1_plen_176_part_00
MEGESSAGECGAAGLRSAAGAPTVLPPLPQPILLRADAPAVSSADPSSALKPHYSTYCIAYLNGLACASAGRVGACLSCKPPARGGGCAWTAGARGGGGAPRAAAGAQCSRAGAASDRERWVVAPGGRAADSSAGGGRAGGVRGDGGGGVAFGGGADADAAEGAASARPRVQPRA